MKCENCFCIYQSNGKCTIEEVSIDSVGMCTDCVYPDIDEKILEQAKSRILKKYNKSDENFQIVFIAKEKSLCTLSYAN